MNVKVHDNLHDINIVIYLGLLNFIFVIYFLFMNLNMQLCHCKDLILIT